MDNNAIKKSLKQGSGSDELILDVYITPEEDRMMEQIRSHSPIDWEGRDLDLLQEAKKIIKDSRHKEGNSVEESVPKQENTNKEQGKKSNKGLWFALAGILLLFIVYEVVTNSINKKAEGIIAQSSMSKTKRTINYEGVTFDYPGNWSVQGQQYSDEMFFVGGSNEKESEFGVFLSKNTTIPIETLIDNIIVGYASSGRFEDVSYSTIYKTTFNNREVLSADYSYTSKGKPYFAKLYGFVVNGSSVIVNPVAHTESALEGDDFKLMESTLKINASR